MKRDDTSRSMWKTMKKEGFAPILGKLLFLILLVGLLLLLVLENAEGGMEWIFVRFPILKKARAASPVVLYGFWLATLWLGFEIGKRAGLKKGADRERKRLGIPF